MKVLLTVFWDPKDLGIRYIATWLRNKGHEVKIVALKSMSDYPPAPIEISPEDAANAYSIRNGYASRHIFNNITGIELELLSREVEKFDPDVIGFGTRSKNFPHLDRIVPALRKGKKDAFIVAGGAGPTLEPHIPLNLGVDAVIRGEGEYALEELLEALSRGKDWKNIQNISYRDEKGEIKRNPMRPPQRDLDAFPFPSLKPFDDIVIDKDAIRPIMDKQDYSPLSMSSNFRYFILGSRGCPAACSYCGGRYLHDEYAKDGILMPRIRQRSLTNVLDELVIAKAELSMRMVQFWDEFFIWPIPKLIKFFKEYKEKIDLPFWAYISPDQLAQSDELMESVIEAGLATFSVGLQTADEKFCKDVYNRINHNENIIKTSLKMLEHEIPVQFLMILANPLQDQASLAKNWEFLANFPFDPSFKQRVWLQCSKLYKPYYQSPLFSAYPELTSSSGAKFYYDAMLCHLRLVCDDNEFNHFVSTPAYASEPSLLGKEFKNLLVKKHSSYLSEQLAQLVENEVYFWGSGTAYTHMKKNCEHLKPLCILNDYTWETERMVDGIPVLNPYSTPLDTSKAVIIFAQHEYVYAINQKAKNLGFKNVIVASLIG